MTDVTPYTPPGRSRLQAIAPEIDEAHGRGLTPRRRAALTAFMEHGTYAAAVRASGLSMAAVKRLIDTDPDGRRAMRDMIETASAAAGVTAERVIAEFAKLAFTDITALAPLMARFETAYDARQALEDLPPAAAALIKEVEFAVTGDGAGMKIKTHDKLAALTSLARTLAMFVDRVEVTDNSAYTDRLRRAVAALDQEDADE